MSNYSKKDERLNQVRINGQNLSMKVIEYISANEIYVQFEDGKIVKTAWKEFNKGSVNNPNYKDKGWGIKRNDRLGEEKYNNKGYKMKIIEYNCANNITVQFDDNPSHKVKTSYQHFIKGITENSFAPSVYGVGITGVEVPCMNGKEKTKEYKTWIRMIERCYSNNQNTREKDPTYNNCWVSDEFLYYPNFYKWIISQDNYEVWKKAYNFALDKDILCKGNKIYSSDKCCLVPNRINNLIKNSKSRRGKYLIGVFKDNHGQYVSQCWNGLLQKNIYLGRFNEEYEAFLAYKRYKEKLIKETAELEYDNGIITKACRDALLNYVVEDTD